MKTKTLLALSGALLFAGNLRLPAQNYAISSFTIAGGGGTSSSGNYILSGTIGQPDTGALAGGSYKLVGGFWSDVITVPIPGGATLTILRSGSNVIIGWPSAAAAFVLEVTDSLSTSPITWKPAAQTPMVSGDQQFISVTPATETKLYRLRRQ
jgi:hypothetical protein